MISYLMVNTNKLNGLRFFTWTCVFLIAFLFRGTCSFAQGLRFNSNDSLINQRTSYDVFAHESPSFKNHLDIDFDLSLWDIEHFGYILNITDKNQNSYSLTYNQGNLYFNIDGKMNKLIVPVEKGMLARRNWLKVLLSLDLQNNKVIITLNNKRYRAAGFNFHGAISPKIVFGKNDRYTDVPEMAVRNLRITDAVKTYVFPLAEWSGEQVHNRQGAIVGTVKNPNWLINESYSWRPIWSSGFNTPVGLNFDSASNELLIFGKEALQRYNVLSSELRSQTYSTAVPIEPLLGKNYLNRKENSLYAYELSPQNSGGSSIASLNLSDNSWKKVGSASLPEQRHHHNSFFDEQSGEFYIFGGYGGFAYHNEFFKYNKLNDTWDKVLFSGDQITPRFFSASGEGHKKGQFYLFGGYGNQSGNQVVGGVHYYDLYRVDLNTRHITKCWEIKPTEKPFVPANNLILSQDGKYFYVLAYPHESAKTYLRLYRFSILDGHYDIVSNKIPVVSERIESDINLFFDESSNQFLCTIQEFTSPQRSTVKLFSLVNPPVTEAMYLEAGKKKESTNPIHLFTWWGLGIVCLLGLIWLYIRRKKSAAFAVEVKDVPAVVRPTVIVPEASSLDHPTSIYLLGEFAVYDNQARNISHLFSPKIQQLFAIILLNSRSGPGVSSKKISACLWPEKEVANSKNIKGVTISNLRNILRDFKGLELTFLNDHYQFKMDDHVFCDYFNVVEFLEQENLGTAELEGHLETLLRGSLLPEMQDAWLDPFKDSFDQSIIARILPELEQAFSEENFKLTLDLSRVILHVDPFNDQAVKCQLNALRRLKGKDAACKYYQHFQTEYQSSLGIAYPLSFEELCS